MVLDAIERLPDSFRIVDLERVAPNVTRDMIRVVRVRMEEIVDDELDLPERLSVKVKSASIRRKSASRKRKR